MLSPSELPPQTGSAELVLPLHLQTAESEGSISKKSEPISFTRRDINLAMAAPEVATIILTPTEMTQILEASRSQGLKRTLSLINSTTQPLVTGIFAS